MAHPCSIVLHKNEWNRLKQQAAVQKPPSVSPDKQRIQKCILQSQNRVKAWPNSVQSQVAKSKARAVANQNKDSNMVNIYRTLIENKKGVNKEAIKNAKQMIFNRTNDGKQLLSALLHSKVIEEREKQIEMKNFIKEEALKQDEALKAKIAAMTDNLYDFSKRDERRKLKHQQIDKERIEHNKMMAQSEKMRRAELAKREKLLELEDARNMQKLLDLEASVQDVRKPQWIKETIQFAADDKKVREDRVKRELLEDELIKACQKRNDIIKATEKNVMAKLLKNRVDTPKMKKTYECIKNAIAKEQKAYDDFVNKGIERHEVREQKALEEQKAVEKEKKETLRKNAEEYNNAIKEKDIIEYWQKCVCERYSLIPTSSKRKTVNKPKQGSILERKHQAGKGESCDKRPEFLKQSTTLKDALKKRSQEPTPWNALEATHKHFAEQAKAILQECTHKELVQKVIQNYSKINCLDANIPRT